MEVPKIIHQIWSAKFKPYPAIFGKLADTWRRYHPDWEYILWDDERMDCFVHTYYPEYEEIFKRFPYDVQRWDVIRYLILYKMGGFYVDCDYECRKPFDSLLGDHTCCLGLEPSSHAAYARRDICIGNALMAVKAGHPFMRELIDHVMSAPIPEVLPRDKIAYVVLSTGPIFLSNLYETSAYRSDIHLMSDEKVAPFSTQECRALIQGERPDNYESRKASAWAIHYFTTCWASQLKKIVN
ncbi:glycosyltransferase family 32 protein [Parabacteroides distasonis]|uniref:glycosyltransferase family 32 protein n=1 Tax=Parabacteroides distasonis TaxID=823 RepID=UPI0018AACDAF|nr:glycosyltransferase [Parabacteroides distasonis]